MLDSFYITPKQWMHILRWIVYTVSFVILMMIETVMIGRHTIMGVHLSFVPVMITCVCMIEGPERGGIYAFLMSLVWCFSGADYGYCSVAVLTCVPILASLICQNVIKGKFIPSLISSAVVLLVDQSFIFIIKYFLGYVGLNQYTSVLLPMVGLSVLSQPILFLLVKAISKIGDKYESV